MEIERVTVDLLSVPLSSPYHLSFGTVTAFDLVFVQLQTGDRTAGYGEIATLDGYFEVGIETVWRESTTLAESVAGTSPGEAADLVAAAEQSLLARSAFLAAVEGLGENRLDAMRAPVVGIASTREGVESTVRSVTDQVERGHTTIKLKIGFDPEIDAECLDAVTKAVPDSVSFRVDANQSYSLRDAQLFLDTTNTTQLALFEQPLPVGNLDSHASLRRVTNVPIMLDEELRGESSLRAVIDADAADIVKFKQMKQGGPSAVRSLTAIARKHGLGVVLGNGVQSDVGCLQETKLWETLDFDTDGEFNGWQKQERSLVDPAPRFEDGELVWDGGPIQPDTETITDLSARHYVTGV